MFNTKSYISLKYIFERANSLNEILSGQHQFMSHLGCVELAHCGFFDKRSTGFLKPCRRVIKRSSTTIAAVSSGGSGAREDWQSIDDSDGLLEP